MTGRPNILLIILDTVRARNTSLHGYPRNTTPFLEEFDGYSTKFLQARSPGIHSISSHVSMFTNREVFDHKAERPEAQIEPHETFWTKLSDDLDYQTGLFTSNPIISQSSNLHECFNEKYSPGLDKQIDLRRTFEDAYLPSASMDGKFPDHLRNCIQHDHTFRSLWNCTSIFVDKSVSTLLGRRNVKEITGFEITQPFKDWTTNTHSPWAACVNLMDAHSPYVPNKKYDKWSEKDAPTDSIHAEKINDYDGCILQVDQVCKDLIGHLGRKGLVDNTLIMITSDHGIGFGEQSRFDKDIKVFDKHYGVNEVLTHVPLLIKFPNQYKSRISRRVVSLTNLPTLVYSTLNRENPQTSFEESGPVFSYTSRLFPDDVTRFPQHDFIDKCVGPWVALYENSKEESETVIKYLKKEENVISVKIPDAHTANVDCSPAMSYEEIDRLMEDSIKRGEVLSGHSAIDRELKDHLNDLGYV